MRAPLPSKYAVKYLRDRSNLLMQSTVRVFRPGTPTFNQSTGMVSGGTSVDIYIGKARIYTMTGSPMPLGDQIVSMNQTIVSIPYDPVNAPPKVDDVVEVKTDDDPGLIGRTYRIIEVEEGGIASSVRHLTVTGVQPDAFSR